MQLIPPFAESENGLDSDDFHPSTHRSPSSSPEEPDSREALEIGAAQVTEKVTSGQEALLLPMPMLCRHHVLTHGMTKL